MNQSDKPECFPCSAELKVVCQCGEILTIKQTAGVSTHRDQGTEVTVERHECSKERNGEQRCVKCGHSTEAEECMLLSEPVLAREWAGEDEVWRGLAASERVPERIFVPYSAANLMAVSPELQNVEGEWYARVRTDSPSVDEAARRAAEKWHES